MLEATLRRVRARREAAAAAAEVGARELLVSSSRAWLLAHNASPRERGRYLYFVVPVLAKIQEEEVALTHLRQELGRPGHSQAKEKEAAMQVQDLLDEMQARVSKG